MVYGVVTGMRPAGADWRAPRMSRQHMEFIVVIVTAAIVLSLLIPAFRRAISPMRQTQCMTNLRQIAVALQMYVNDCGAMPPMLDTLYRDHYVRKPSVFVCSADKDARGYVGKYRKATEHSFSHANLPLMSYVYDEQTWGGATAKSALPALAEEMEGGVVACPCHGELIQQVPSITVYSGRVLRLRIDGSVFAAAVRMRAGEWDPRKLLGCAPAPVPAAGTP